ncbi:MAG: mycofactocin system GMC family oxidoreductase MftG [Gordonia sp. (in: high G+C Gram-positive bacteria)]
MSRGSVLSGIAPTTTADVVIVGAGSAGCVLADKLSRDGSRQVLLLEQGPLAWPEPSVLDVRRLPIAAGDPYVTRHRGAPEYEVVRGRGLGGSSVVNGGYFLRWHPGDFDGWPTGWSLADIDAAYAELDAPGGTMHVHPCADDDIGDAAAAFEKYWAHRLPIRAPGERWPVLGVNRVLTNSVDGYRRTAAQAYLSPALGRAGLSVCADSRVDAIVTNGRRVVGVRVGGYTVRCAELILCAGTLGTAELLLRSGIESLAAPMRVGEHREMLVGYRRTGTAPVSGMVLPSVVHTDDGIEIRCYRDDFAKYIRAIPATGPVIGVSAMRPASSGMLHLADGAVRLQLEPPDAPTLRRMSAAAQEVAAMLRSAEFAALVIKDSVRIDPVIRTSQHAWGCAAMGLRTDWLGGVDGIRGLRIVDGSILPTAGRSGPHATTMMLACRIGDLLAAGAAGVAG